MGRAPSPAPRWLRRMVAFTPLVVVTACPVAVLVVHPHLVLLTVPLTLVAVVVGVRVARVELRADRHVTPAMAARYRVLARLVDNAQDREERVDAEHRFSLLLLDERCADGSVQRTLLRFDQHELDNAGHDGARTPVVFDQFILDPHRPLVRHRLAAVVITREAGGRTRVAELPRPDHGKRAAAATARLLARTALEIPSTAELDLLIDQVRSTSAITS